jgi:hypothetical protein
MIMVLSCFDFLVVITSHPLDTLRLALWLNEEYDLLNATNIHRHFWREMCTIALYIKLVKAIFHCDRFSRAGAWSNQF